MTEGALTREQILEAAEEVLRRFGPAKATVVDVARALGVSHGSVYRHFASKAELRDAVAERWLARVSAPLAAIATASGPASARLERWFEALMAAKRTKVSADPELFATYSRLVSESREVVREHIEILVGQLTVILADGARTGELDFVDPVRAARAVFQATGRFHNPYFAAEWQDPHIDRDFAELLALLLRGLGARPPQAAVTGDSRARGIVS